MVAVVQVNIEADACFSDCSARVNFHRLVNREIYPGVLEGLQSWLQAGFDSACSPVPQDFVRALTNPALAVDSDAGIPARTTTDTGCGRALYMLRQRAPLAMTEFHWLRTVSGAANAHRPEIAELFLLYSRLRDSGWLHRRTAAFRALLHKQGLILPASQDCAFSRDPRLLDASFEAALTGLGLGCIAPLFAGELIGFTLAHLGCIDRYRDSAEYHAATRAGLPEDYWASVPNDCHRAELKTLIRHAASRYVLPEAGRGADQTRCERVWSGYRRYLLQEQQFLHCAATAPVPEPGPAERVMQMFRRRAATACGYHRRVRLGGRSLDSWFGEGLPDAGAFLTALRDSPYFNTPDPCHSRFLAQACAADGVMSGVFSESEKQLIVEWLQSGSDQVSLTLLDPPTLDSSGAPGRDRPAVARRAPAKRDLYHRLVNLHRYPQVLPHARAFVDRQLRISRMCLGLNRSAINGFFEYSESAFNYRIDRIHVTEMQAYRPLQGPPRLSREAVVWGIEQFAPAILVDGCWLQTIAEYADETDPVQARLWSIYADEVGNGRVADNHANIYRALLESVDIELPAVDSEAFARHPGFIASAFDLPVYLLAISRFPRCYLPELLGLNLAIELSGLGAGYMRLVETLRYWKLDPAIVSLHLSIDNLCSGHSALARDAVNLYLQRVLRESGYAVMQQHWKRIWTGYLSLQTAPARFAGELIIRYMTRFGFTRYLKQGSPGR